VPGVVIAAAYMLRVLQRVAWGGTQNPVHHDLKDLDFREIITLTPLLVFVLWIGLHPQPFVHVMHATVLKLLQQVGAALPQAAAILP
jgi:NADH-quinone oxidoreductase subunit M